MKMLFLIVALCILPIACRAEDPRIAEAEAIAVDTCACVYLACAVETAAPLLEQRGLEQEDYANLPPEHISRYEAAYEETGDCVRRWILE